MIAPLPLLRQAGVIPYRVIDGKVELLLVTSRGSGRWIIPKGNVGAGSTVIKAAEAEAFEEAGVRGVIKRDMPLGSYTYLKQLASGDFKPAVVEVYLLRTIRQAKKWPEKAQRAVAWVSIEQAIARHGEPGLAPLLERLIDLEPTLVRGDEPLSTVRFGS
jgi:8-oxo-dGTP pyrophosphatase MutT (NUDIX family)